MYVNIYIGTSLKFLFVLLLIQIPFFVYVKRFLTETIVSFTTVSPTEINDTRMGITSQVLQYGNPKIWFYVFKKHACLSVPAVMFCKQFLAYTQQICTIEPSFFIL